MIRDPDLAAFLAIGFEVYGNRTCRLVGVCRARIFQTLLHTTNRRTQSELRYHESVYRVFITVHDDGLISSRSEPQ